MTTLRRRAATLTVIALLVAGCGDDEDGAGATSTTTSVPATTTTTAAPTSTTTAPPTEEPLDPDPNALEPGEHVVLVTGLREGSVAGEAVQLLQFDKVLFLTGDEAVVAAREHGDIGPEETAVDDDYYVVNDNPLLRELPVRADAEVLVLVGGTPELVPGTLADVLASTGRLHVLTVEVDAGQSWITRVEGLFTP